MVSAAANNAWNPQQWWEQAAALGLTSEQVLRVVQQLVAVLVLLVLGWMISRLLSRVVRTSMERAKLDATLRSFFVQATRWTILVFTGLAVLSLFGIETTSLAALIGAAGLAIGLALQGALGSFAAGIMLLVFRPYRVGDLVNVNGTLGFVQDLELFTTTLDTPDNRRYVVPNASIFGNTIENLTHHPSRRIEILVPVGYLADVDHTRVVLREAIASIPEVLVDPEPVVYLMELGMGTLQWSVRAWVPTVDFWPLRDRLIRAVKAHLDAAGIPLAFPQLQVHTDSV